MGISMENEVQTEKKVNNGGIFLFPSRMTCIRCPECGGEILMLPTLGKMVEAIENHISVHRTQQSNVTCEDTLKPANIRTDLTEQVLEQASRMIAVSQKSPL